MFLNEPSVLSIADYSSVLSQLEQTREHFFSNETPYPHLPRTTIFESWQRSKKRSIPFKTFKAPVELECDHLLREIRKNRLLFEIISPYLQDIAGAFPDNVVSFSNENGIILDIRGSEKIAWELQESNYVAGANWSESVFGTNGIGTALETSNPVQVFASEHYAESGRDWICSSAPIREPVSGVILGVLTITAKKHFIPAHNLNWVIREAQNIEKALQGRLQEESSTLFDLIFEKAEQPCIIYKTSGEICRINSSAYQRFNAKPGDSLDAVFDVSAKESPFLHQFNQSFSIVSRHREQRFRVTASPWAVGEREIGGVAFLQNEPSGTRRPSNAGKSQGTRYEFSSFIGQNGSLRKTLELAEKASRVNSTILITGETGTGKEVLAQAIHNNSRQKEKSFISVNCGAIPKELIAAELFGYVDGAFTGAQKGGKTGKFEAANGGTLFLDEIGDMPLDLQVYLLRVLEEGSITRIGSHENIPLDVRVICATNKNLLHEIELGRFRRDLFYRLNTIEICLPPLRENREDIPLLAAYYLQRFNVNYRLTQGAVDKLTDYSWPGNVRELRNVIERAAFVSDDNIITENDIHLPDKQYIRTNFRSKAVSGVTNYNILPDKIIQVLEECRGNASLAARCLNISRTTLYRKMKQYGIN